MTDAPDNSEGVKRYEISLVAGDVRESRFGFWMHASDHDAKVAELQKERDELREGLMACNSNYAGLVKQLSASEAMLDKAREASSLLHGARMLIEGPTLMSEANCDDWSRRADAFLPQFDAHLLGILNPTCETKETK